MFTKKDKKDMEQREELDLVTLRSINNEYELDVIKAILDENEIPYIIKDTGIGGYMRVIGGTSIYGTEILVERSTIKDANDILEGINLDSEEDE